MIKIKYRTAWSWGYGNWMEVEIHELDWASLENEDEKGEFVIDEIVFARDPFIYTYEKFRGVEWEVIEYG